MFQIEKQNGKIIRILDNRYDTPVDITDGTGRFGYLAYTLKSQDINKELKPGSVPFAEQYAGFDESFENAEFGAKLTAEETAEGLVMELACNGEQVDGAGLFLPFNFISRKNGFWQQQFTVSSPYHSADYSRHLFYLARPDGKGIVCVVENEITCYMVNYSPYQGGHFIRGITFWASLDKAYGKAPKSEKQVKVHILPVSGYKEALEKACKIWDCSALSYSVSSGYAGQPFRFTGVGNVDEIVITSPSGKKQTVKQMDFIPQEYGFYQAVPYYKGKPGLDCTMFCMDDFHSMHERATLAIHKDRDIIIGHTPDGQEIYEPTHLYYRNYKDFNLCEHCMWAWSALQALQRGLKDSRIEEDALNLLRIMDPANGLQWPRCSYDPADNYNTFGDYRIQEAFNGINILLAAYKHCGEKAYLALAKTALKAKLKVDQMPDGGVYRWAGRGEERHQEDYTTVTFMVLPVVDMAVLLREENDPDAEFFAQAAIRMADHMVSRGMDFPTEGGGHPEVNVEVEEGSMSCTALTVLYVYGKLCPKPAYLDFATAVLDFHDCYSVYTPHPVMFRSSLRWWETIWEGDADGPATCFGHAWTVWRAEAEYWYGLLAKNDERLLDSYNGFMSNLAKTDKDGNMYAIYQYEMLSSPAMEDRGWMIDRASQEGFPKHKDRTLSRYAWARMCDTWFHTVAVLPEHILMAKEENGVITPQCKDFDTLYLGDVSGTFCVKTDRPFRVISKGNATVEGTGFVKVTVTE